MILRTELDDLGVLLTYSYINIEVVANISIDVGGLHSCKMTSLHLVDPPRQKVQNKLDVCHLSSIAIIDIITCFNGLV